MLLPFTGPQEVIKRPRRIRNKIQKNQKIKTKNRKEKIKAKKIDG